MANEENSERRIEVTFSNIYLWMNIDVYLMLASTRVCYKQNINVHLSKEDQSLLKIETYYYNYDVELFNFSTLKLQIAIFLLRYLYNKIIYNSREIFWTSNTSIKFDWLISSNHLWILPLTFILFHLTHHGVIKSLCIESGHRNLREDI